MLTTYGIGDYFAATAPGLTRSVSKNDISLVCKLSIMYIYIYRMLTALEKRFQKTDPELAAHFVTN